MGVQEIKDDFLLSMGCSISNRYNYINDDGYDYFAKLEEKDVKINNKNIPVRKAIGNTMLLNSDLAISGTQAMLKVAEELPGQSALVSMMDLSLEADAFGSSVEIYEDEVPTVIGSIVNSKEDAESLVVPELSAGRCQIYVDAIAKYEELLNEND